MSLTALCPDSVWVQEGTHAKKTFPCVVKLCPACAFTACVHFSLSIYLSPQVAMGRLTTHLLLPLHGAITVVI